MKEERRTSAGVLSGDEGLELVYLSVEGVDQPLYQIAHRDNPDDFALIQHRKGTNASVTHQFHAFPNGSLRGHGDHGEGSNLFGQGGLGSSVFEGYFAGAIPFAEDPQELPFFHNQYSLLCSVGSSTRSLHEPSDPVRSNTLHGLSDRGWWLLLPVDPFQFPWRSLLWYRLDEGSTRSAFLL